MSVCEAASSERSGCSLWSMLSIALPSALVYVPVIHGRKRTSDTILYIPEETSVNNTNLLSPQIPLEYSGIC